MNFGYVKIDFSCLRKLYNIGPTEFYVWFACDLNGKVTEYFLPDGTDKTPRKRKNYISKPERHTNISRLIEKQIEKQIENQGTYAWVGQRSYKDYRKIAIKYNEIRYVPIAEAEVD